MSTDTKHYIVSYMLPGPPLKALVYTTPAQSAGEARDLVAPRFREDLKTFGYSPDSFVINTDTYDATRVQRICHVY